VPALFAVFPISVGPILGCRPVDDEIEPIAVGIFAGFSFTFNVEGFEPSSHVILQ
jgi:hypothetical protein